MNPNRQMFEDDFLCSPTATRHPPMGLLRSFLPFRFALHFLGSHVPDGKKKERDMWSRSDAAVHRAPFELSSSLHWASYLFMHTFHFTTAVGAEIIHSLKFGASWYDFLWFEITLASELWLACVKQHLIILLEKKPALEIHRNCKRCRCFCWLSST